MGASGDAALPNVPGMPEAGCIGMAIDGVPMFPNYNNRGQPAATSCEIDRCNAHSGKGDDYHYHGDPFGSKVRVKGLCHKRVLSVLRFAAYITTLLLQFIN